MVKPTITLLVNLIAPSRIGVYERLASAMNLIILHGGMESNRDTWKEANVHGACVRRVAGWQLPLTKRDNGKVIDHRYLHLEPGYITELVRRRPDAVITFEIGFRTIVGLAYGACFRKPVWVWWGGTAHTERQVGRFRMWVRRIVARWAKQWISYGQTSTEYLLSLGVPKDRILQVQNCVDETWYGNSVEPALDVRPKPVFLYVGQMIARKGVAEFLHAAARLQQEGLTFSTVLVGGGRDSAQLMTLANELHLENISFYPAQAAELMPAFYRSGDVLIFPTMEDVWGLVANEAVLSGLPVLCSRYAGCAPELFNPECIFDPADEEQFVAALRKAVRGELPRTDRSRLKRSAEVGDLIANAVLEVCVGAHPTKPSAKADAISRSAVKS
jgi:glycosyltransferase involved in cell wall biosynthesis